MGERSSALVHIFMRLGVLRSLVRVKTEYKKPNAMESQVASRQAGATSRGARPQVECVWGGELCGLIAQEPCVRIRTRRPHPALA